MNKDRLYLYVDDTYYGTGDYRYLLELMTDHLQRYRKPVKFEVVPYETMKERTLTMRTFK